MKVTACLSLKILPDNFQCPIQLLLRTKFEGLAVLYSGLQ
jgi:hypothetical protein